MSFLSRYSPRYIRTLVYMLQASEYSLRDFYSWYHRTSDFSAVEKRKSLVWTAKARIVYALLAATAIVLLPLLVFMPYVLPYAAVVPLALVSLTELPVRYARIRRARTVLRRHPGVKIAIAGSFGKTSMREALKAVLSAGKRVAAPPGSHNTPLGIAQFVATLTGDEEVLIFEFGEYYPGDVKKLCDLVHPDIGIITGVNEAHLEKFKTLDRTADTIFELADFLKDKPLYINGDSALARARAHAADIIYDSDGAGETRVVSAQTGLSGTDIVLDVHGARVSAQSALLGHHHVGPIAAAAHIAHALGLSPEAIAKGIQNTKPFEHRMEPKDVGGVVTLDDSYNGNPDGVRAVINFLAEIKDRRRFYVTPGLVEMGARKVEVHQEIGRQLAAAGIEKVVLIRNSVTGYIAEGLKEAGYSGEVLWFDDGPKAFSALPHLTVPGDVVLLQNDWPDQYA